MVMVVSTCFKLLIVNQSNLEQILKATTHSGYGHVICDLIHVCLMVLNEGVMVFFTLACLHALGTCYTLLPS